MKTEFSHQNLHETWMFIGCPAGDFSTIFGHNGEPPRQVQVVGTMELSKPRALPLQMAEWLEAAHSASEAVVYVSSLGSESELPFQLNPRCEPWCWYIYLQNKWLIDVG